MNDVIQQRPLTPADKSSLETFLALHRDSSMFLRANVRRAGLTYQGLRGEANYAGAFRDDRVVGVAAHCWNGMLLLQAPEHAAELARAAVEWSGRPVTGLSGPLEQVRQARSELELDSADVALDGAEWLYALDLSQLVVPEPLSNGTVVCRPPRPEERDALCAWRLAYDIELLGATASPSTRRRSEEFLDAQIAEGNAWVAVPVLLRSAAQSPTGAHRGAAHFVCLPYLLLRLNRRISTLSPISIVIRSSPHSTGPA